MDFAGTIGHLGTGQVTFWNGAVSGAIFWLGLIATTIAVNHRYQGSTFSSEAGILMSFELRMMY